MSGAADAKSRPDSRDRGGVAREFREPRKRGVATARVNREAPLPRRLTRSYVSVRRAPPYPSSASASSTREELATAFASATIRSTCSACVR